MAKVFAAAGCVLLAAAGGAAVVGSARFADRLAADGLVFDGATDQTDLLAAGVGDVARIGGFCGLPVILLAGYLLVRVLRRDAWLDGTRLYVRGALFTTSADLARADVRVRRGVLAAQDPGHGRTVRLPLRGLTSYERDALVLAAPSLRTM